MSGHSKWSTIKRQKGVADVKRGNLFTKLSNAITIAVHEGGGEGAIARAREASMPKDNIQRAIDKGLGKSGEHQLQTVIYEGFGPLNVAVIMETITDNTNRTGGELRNIFDKNGGHLGAVNYMFKRIGNLRILRNLGNLSSDEVLEKALEAGVEDFEEDEEGFSIFTKPEELHKVKEKLEKAGLTIVSAGLAFRPNKDTMVSLDEAQTEKVMNFVEKIEELDDVQNVFVNV